VKIEAVRLGLPVLEPESLRDPGFLERLREAMPEAVVVVAFGRLLPQEILESPPRGCINLHGSILPRWRGAAPVARAIMAGDSRTGVSTMMMDKGLDTGDILMTRASPIDPQETAGELSARLAILGADLVVETLAAVERGTIPRQPQDPALATLAPPLRREDGTISWDAPAGVIAAQVRGCNPWPVACAALDGRRVQILRAVEQVTAAGAARDTTPEPGRVVEAGRDRVLVACADGTRLEILEIRLPGGKLLRARDALNGRLVKPGDRFAPPPA
jgi:methionyl-tRNA formyltransferase